MELARIAVFFVRSCHRHMLVQQVSFRDKTRPSVGGQEIDSLSFGLQTDLNYVIGRHDCQQRDLESTTGYYGIEC